MLSAVALLLVVWGCRPAHVPEQLPPRTALQVSASFDRTWEAALAAFAAQNIEVLQDRPSGTVVSRGTPNVLPGDTGGQNCGLSRIDGKIIQPQQVKYRVTIQKDGTTSKVLALATYLYAPGIAVQECGSRGTWEAAFEADIKRRAETP